MYCLNFAGHGYIAPISPFYSVPSLAQSSHLLTIVHVTMMLAMQKLENVGTWQFAERAWHLSHPVPRKWVIGIQLECWSSKLMLSQANITGS